MVERQAQGHDRLGANEFREESVDAVGNEIQLQPLPTEETCMDAPDYHDRHAEGKKAFFKKKSCAVCHTVDKDGGETGPNLTDYGSAEWIRFMMMSPAHTERHGDNNQKILLAYSLEGDKPVWRYVQAGTGHSAGGTMTTAGGLVFFGDDAQSFEAVDAQTGKPLWHFNTGQNFTASPMSYAINSKQYVAIAAGSDVFSFALP